MADSCLYPYFTASRFIDAKFIFLIFVLIFCFYSFLLYKPSFSKIITNLNSKTIFPLTLLLSSVFVLITKFNLNHSTFVLHYFKVHSSSFNYLFLASAFLYFFYPKPDYTPKKKILNLQLLGPLLLAFFILLKIYFLDLFLLISQEDHLIEYVQFFLYLISAIIFYKISRQHYRQKNKLYFYTFLYGSLALFAISFEEISWGQRIINLNTPQTIKQINMQDELTLHNIRPIQLSLHLVYMAIGLYGTFSYFLISKYFPAFFKKTKLFYPPPHLSFYFFFIFAFFFIWSYQYLYYDFFSEEQTVYSYWQESAELFLALGFVFYAQHTHRLFPS